MKRAYPYRGDVLFMVVLLWLRPVTSGFSLSLLLAREEILS